MADTEDNISRVAPPESTSSQKYQGDWSTNQSRFIQWNKTSSENIAQFTSKLRLLNGGESTMQINVDQSSIIPFYQQIDQAIHIRNDNIQQIKRFIQQHSQHTENTNRCLRMCDDKIECNGVTVAVVGRLNAGKSMLVSALLDWEVDLPSSDEVTTIGRMTRFVYSDTPIIRQIRTEEWEIHQYYSEDSFQCENPNYNESVISEEVLSEEKMRDYIQLTEQNRDNLEICQNMQSLSTIIEIGIPSQLLKTGLTIIDCPGFDDNEILTDMKMIMLNEIKPSIIGYVYDHRQGFNMNDGQILKQMNVKFKSIFETIIVANKCDSFKAKEQHDDIQFDQHQANETIRSNTPWKHSMTPPFIDKDRMLPVLSSSTMELRLSQSTTQNQYRTMFNNLQNQIVLKIIDHSRSILFSLAEHQLFESDIDLYLMMKSLSVEENLIELIESECCHDANLLVDFSGGYKLFGLHYRDDEIHVTATPYSSKLRWHEDISRYSHRYCRFRYVESLMIYVNDDKSIIYLIEKERSHKRLIDHLEEYSLDQLIDYLNQIWKIIDGWQFCIEGFRADNVYVDDRNGSVSLNLSVPNIPDLPFLLKDGQPVQPFHPHSQLEFADYCEKLNIQIKIEVQNRHSFGCLVWILIDGRGTEWFDVNDPDLNARIQLLQNGRFPHYPRYLSVIMKDCFKHHLDDRLNRIHEEMKEKSHIEFYFIQYYFVMDEALRLQSDPTDHDERCSELQRTIVQLCHELSNTTEIYTESPIVRIYSKFLYYLCRYQMNDMKNDFTLMNEEFPASIGEKFSDLEDKLNEIVEIFRQCEEENRSNFSTEEDLNCDELKEFRKIKAQLSWIDGSSTVTNSFLF